MRPVNTFDSVDGTANDCQKFKVKCTSNDFGNKVGLLSDVPTNFATFYVTSHPHKQFLFLTC